jgi:signal transduction histidine kinase/CheY-like chemotaxis protein
MVMRVATEATALAKSHDERFLLLAPTGRDAPLTVEIFARGGLTCTPCHDIDELCTRFQGEGAAALLIVEEVLVPRAFARLCTMLQEQESWSDVPILLFTASSATLQSREPSARALAPLGNVTLLERPLRPITLLSAANAALRARRRQYEARAELHAQQRAVRQRDQFLAMLGHELRNPLAAIALANGSVRGRRDAQAERCDDIIGRQVKHLTRLVDDLLDVARVTSGKITLRKVFVDLGKLAEACLESLAPVFAREQLSHRLEKPSGPIGVMGDPVRLEQVLTNLLTNASKYTPPGGSIVLSIARERGAVTLSVRDDGIGISPDMLDRVFDLFAQVDGSLDRAQGGLGIGLTLVRSVIELHGGRIRAESAGLGRGSTFSIRLPEAPPPSAAAPREPARTPAPEPGVLEVLVVEDNDDSRELMAMVIERLGHVAHTAADGPGGVERALAQRPDVVIVDIGLPGLDGYSVARKLRASLGRTVSLVALTGYGQPDDRRRALDAGFDAHFTKPLDLEAFSELLGTMSPRARGGKGEGNGAAH